MPTPQPQQPQQPQQQPFFDPTPVEQPVQKQQQQGFAVKTKDTNPELAALWANREGGLDTFGNVGSLRGCLLRVPVTSLAGAGGGVKTNS